MSAEAEASAADRSLVEQFATRIDGLDAAAFDALPFGAILVDGRGTIHRYNMAESRLSGRAPARVIGRNFFHDVAPCTNLPGFAGRFRAGVASGTLDATVEFDFDFHMAPVRVEVRMRDAAEPDRYWLLVRKIADLVPNRPRDAVAMVAARAGVSVVGAAADYSVCELEPIRTPGAVQPWGALLAADPASLTLVAASENAGPMLGRPAAPGMALAAALGEGPAAAVGWWLAAGEAPIWNGEMRGDTAFDLRAHRAGDAVIVEIEPVPPRDGAALAAMIAGLEGDIAAIRACESLPELAQAVARAVRRTTGFERALVYRFDPDWHGEVIGEDKVPDWDQSFAGMHFPASDIPRQARELYLKALVRHVPGRDYVPVPVRAAAGAPPLDLSLARHRSVSPVHLEYHRNMGVNGSISFSILVEGRLWGLVACHHRRPHYAEPALRSAAMALVDAMALRIAAVERTVSAAGRAADLDTLNALIVKMAAADSLVAPLAEGERTLLGLFGAGGVALRVDGRRALLGRAPPAASVAALAAWLDGHWDETGFYATDALSAHFPEAQEFRDTASGLFAMRLAAGDYVMWLRAEQPRVLNWGGDPAKPMAAEGGRPLPRASFARWIEERRGHSDPWPSWAPEVATLLRHAVGDVMLRHLRQVARLNEQLRDSNEAKAQFLANMSHELRTPLNAILGFSDLMAAGVGGRLASRHAEYVADIHASGAHLLALVNDILDVSRIDAGRLELSPEDLALGAVVEDCLAMVRPRAARKQIEVAADVPAGLTVHADRLRLRQILINLATNAVKFTPPGGRVRVAARREGGTVAIEVADTGRGMTPAEIEIALQPFRQVRSDTRTPEEGSGLGLPIARSLAELHGGSLTVESRPGAGTRATVRLPLTRPDAA